MIFVVFGIVFFPSFATKIERPEDGSCPNESAAIVTAGDKLTFWHFLVSVFSFTDMLKFLRQEDSEVVYPFPQCKDCAGDVEDGAASNVAPPSLQQKVEGEASEEAVVVVS